MAYFSGFCEATEGPDSARANDRDFVLGPLEHGGLELIGEVLGDLRRLREVIEDTIQELADPEAHGLVHGSAKPEELQHDMLDDQHALILAATGVLSAKCNYKADNSVDGRIPLQSYASQKPGKEKEATLWLSIDIAWRAP